MVVFISEKDASNIILAHIAKAFLRQSFEVVIYAPFYDENVLRYFDACISRAPIGKLQEIDLSEIEMVFCSTLSSLYFPEILFRVNKPIFTYNYLMNRQVNWGGDICFVPSKWSVESDYDEFLHYSYVSVGDPKSDTCHRVTTKNNRLLFVDSGHFPFSKEGKSILAKLLLTICEDYPEYEIKVKTRFYPGDSVITHENRISLIDCLYSEANKTLPENLTFSSKNEDLQGLVDESDAVICLYSTAFTSAVAAKKGLIILENIPSEDVYDIREKTFLRTKECMTGSGACIDYADAYKKLPLGIVPSDSYRSRLLEETEGVSDKIVEICVYLWSEFYNKNRFPKQVYTNYKGYREDFIYDSDATWEKVISKRYLDFMFYKSVILMDFHMKAKPDISLVLSELKKIEDKVGIVTDESFHRFMLNKNDIRDGCIIANRDRMLEDDIDSGILLNAYYLQRQFDDIRNFPKTDISAYDFYRAIVAIEDFHEANDETAKYHLKLYFEKTKGRSFRKEITDMPGNKKKAEDYWRKIGND